MNSSFAGQISELFWQSLDPFHPLAGPSQELLSRARANREILMNDSWASRTHVLKDAPRWRPTSRSYHGGWVRLGEDCEDAKKEMLPLLLRLNPWRKGPFRLFGLELDAEWRADIKWDRLLPALGTLKGERVLDIGCSNGYHMFRMLDLEPRWVLGVDPSPLFHLQFAFLQQYARESTLFHEMLTLEDLEQSPIEADVIFCMGVLYHRRSPLDTLRRLHGMLAPGGRLILETLYVPGEEAISLCPFPTYAKMKNVFFLPTLPCLEAWFSRAGFTGWQMVSAAVTTTLEQRNTAFCPRPLQSLADFLDPSDSSRTVEGYPSPRRACYVVRKPGLTS